MDPAILAGIIIATAAVLIFVFICIMDGWFCLLNSKLKKVDRNEACLENGFKPEKEPSAPTNSIEYKRSDL